MMLSEQKSFEAWKASMALSPSRRPQAHSRQVREWTLTICNLSLVLLKISKVNAEIKHSTWGLIWGGSVSWVWGELYKTFWSKTIHRVALQGICHQSTQSTLPSPFGSCWITITLHSRSFFLWVGKKTKYEYQFPKTIWVIGSRECYLDSLLLVLVGFQNHHLFSVSLQGIVLSKV